MRLIKPNVEIIEQSDYTLDGIYKMIELAGRTCYKSEDKITETSAKEFVNRMIKSGHGAMLEHGTVYLKIIGVFLDPKDCDVAYGNYTVSHFIRNKYSKVVIKHDKEWKSNVYITTNYRVIIENNWLDDLQYICEPTEFHEKRITVKWTTDRVTGESFLRHRVFSFARESTRYCNYSKDKFDNEIKFIIPTWLNLVEGKYKWEDQNPLLTAGLDPRDVGYDDSSDLWIKVDDGSYIEYKRHYKTWRETEEFMHLLQASQDSYFSLLNQGWQPQQARQVLPFSVHSPLVMTGFESDWKGFFDLRCDKAAHPDAQYLAKMLLTKFNDLNPKFFKDYYEKYCK